MATGQRNISRKFTFKERSNIRKNLDLSSEIQRFLDTKKLENRSPKTVKTYAQTLSHFEKWFAESDDEYINKETLRNYIAFMRNDKTKWDDHETLSGTTEQKGVSARTANNIIRNLRVFFNWAVAERVLSENPAENVNYLTEDRNTFEVFTDEDVMSLLNTPNIKTYTGFRDYVMMLVLIDTGIRIGELTNLRIENVDLKLRQITVPSEVSKNRTVRVLPISKKTRDEIEKLIDYINVEHSDYLFLSQFGERYQSDSFSKMLRNYGRKACVTIARCSPHTFRHYFAVKYLRSGGESFSLMRILGHSDMTMTNRYVRYVIGDIQENHDIASPVENLHKKKSLKNRKGKVKLF